MKNPQPTTPIPSASIWNRGLPDWHHQLNRVSGQMVLAFKDGTNDEVLHRWAQDLRQLADAISGQAK